MPFVRVSRDKRGYEQIALLHFAGGRRGKPSKPQLLYVFRTPPGVKVGREPFDLTVREALEAQNPGIVFDWKKLSNIPAPAVDVEYWREKRRLEKAAKQARRAEELAETIEATDDAVDAEEEPGDLESTVDADRSREAGSEDPPTAPAVPEASGPVEAPPHGSPEGRRRRRRRGGRRRRRGGLPSAVATRVGDPPHMAESEEASEARESKLPEDPPKEA